MTPRILIFSTAYFPLVGGAEVAMKEMTDRMPEYRFHLVCAKIRPGLLSVEKIGNVTVHRVGFGHPIDKFLLPALGVIETWSWKDVSLVWSLMARYGGFAALAYTWVHPRAKMLLTLQEGDPLEHYDRRTGWLHFLHRMIFRRADAVQPISRFLGEWAMRMGFRGTPEVIPNGVDVAAFSQPIGNERRAELRRRHAFADDDTVVITASRLSHKNGVGDLVRAMALLPASFKLLLAGDGEDRDKLQTLVRELNVASRVVFHGTASHAELPGLLQASDIFVRASRSEGLGCSFLEAMAAGIPIIGTPVGGIPDFLTDGETGVFCLPDNAESIATAVKRIAGDTVLRERLIANGLPLVRARYSWDDLAQKMRAMVMRTMAS